MAWFRSLALAASMLALTTAACTSSSGAKVSAAGHAGRPLDIRITVDRTTARAGTSITGTAIITNSTAHPIEIKDCHGDWLNVALANGATTSESGWEQCLTLPPTQLPVGTMRMPITIDTTYSECSPHGGSIPACIHDPSGRLAMPPLPPGTYSTIATMLAPENGVPEPTPNTFQITLTP